MNVGELKAMLDDYGDQVDVSIVITDEDSGDETRYTEFSVDYSSAIGDVVLEVEVSS
jgi:hypothetical protein